MSNNANIPDQLDTWREDDLVAYTQNSRAFRKGISPFEAVDYYSQWAECHQYDEDLRPGRYNGPLITANAVAEFFPQDREEKKIMDIAAGTGFVAEHLKAKGFRHIDALEPSTQMLLRAKEKGLYENYYTDFLSDDPLPTIMEDTYDCVVICGGMGEGHIPCSGIRELIRITKQGGLICIVMREQYLIEVDEYKDRLEPLMDFLEMAGKWVQVARYTVPDYFINIPGVVYMYNKI
ncbi:methyltransferase-like protein 27 [Haliotis asinina]|uniref:methyltransferase-like protein 27 n=1 Tax=Haliotis asinina TaxID=109174 RepID=UPI003531B4EE